jgi:hypothetical protein
MIAQQNISRAGKAVIKVVGANSSQQVDKSLSEF